MSAHGSASPERLDALEGIRGIAALVVFAFHLTWRSPVFRDAVGPVSGHFDTGVEVFFLMSGFLIFRPFAKAIVERGPFPDTPRYIARRAARVWPGYLVALGVIIALGIADIHGFTGFLKQASLTFLYFHDRGGVALTLAWTLVVEISFYAFVPVIARVLRVTGGRLLEVSILCVGVGAFAQVYVAHHQDTPLWLRILPPAMLSLGLGMLFASVRSLGPRAGGVGAALRWVAARPLLPLGVAALAFAALAWVVPAASDVWKRPDERALKEILQAVIAAGVTFPVMLSSGVPDRLQRTLANRHIAYIGTISFGFYLWHIPVLGRFERLLVSDRPALAVLGWMGALLCSLALAAASWHLIELPATKAVGRRIAARPAADPDRAG